MIKKVDEQDYSKPSTEIDYATKARKKRRRGVDVEDEYPKKKTLAPYKREHLNLLVEDEHNPLETDYFCVKLGRNRWMDESCINCVCDDNDVWDHNDEWNSYEEEIVND